MKTNTIKLACAALLTLSVAAISTSVSAEDWFPKRSGGFDYSRGYELDEDNWFPKRSGGFDYSRGYELDEDNWFPKRSGGFDYSRGYELSEDK